MAKGTGEREKDGVDVKQGSLAAYSIARDVSVLWISSPPPYCHLTPFSLFLALSVRSTFYLPSFSVSFRRDRPLWLFLFLLVAQFLSLTQPFLRSRSG